MRRQVDSVRESAMKEKSRYTDAEVRDALRQLMPEDSARIGLTSKYYEVRSGIEADELRQRAYLRLLKHSCERSFAVADALLGMIRSEASGKDARWRIGQKQKLLDVDNFDWGMGPETPEEAVIRTQQEARAAQLIDQLRLMFSHRPPLLRLIEGRLMDLSGADLRDFAGLDEREMKANLKALSRGVAKLRVIGNDQ